MTAKVLDLLPPGYGGLTYEARRMRDTHRWAVVGRPPGRPNAVAVVIEVKKLAPMAGEEKAFVEEIARLLTAGYGPIEIHAPKEGP